VRRFRRRSSLREQRRCLCEMDSEDADGEGGGGRVRGPGEGGVEEMGVEVSEGEEMEI